MDKEKKTKPFKKRSDKYDSKLAINGTFEQVIQVSFLGGLPKKEPPKGKGGAA